MTSRIASFLTPEQYLEIDRKAERKSEYSNGEMFAMAGASRAHNLIATNTARQASNQLRSKPCEVYQGDMRVRIVATGLNTYPDIIVCGEPQLLDDCQDTLLNPKFIVEILSPSTEACDGGRKFEHYRHIDSLEHYLLLSQDRMQAELYSRQPEGKWVLTSASQPEDIVELDSIGCHLSLAECYEKIHCQPDTAPKRSGPDRPLMRPASNPGDRRRRKALTTHYRLCSLKSNAYRKSFATCSVRICPHSSNETLASWTRLDASRKDSVKLRS